MPARYKTIRGKRYEWQPELGRYVPWHINYVGKGYGKRTADRPSRLKTAQTSVIKSTGAGAKAHVRRTKTKSWRRKPETWYGERPMTLLQDLVRLPGKVVDLLLWKRKPRRRR